MRFTALSALVLGGLSSSWVLAAGGKPAPERPRLTLGVVLPLSGPQAAFGREAQRGIDLAMDLLRQTDPEQAQTVTVIVADDQSTVGEAKNAAERLVRKERAHILLGSLSAAAVQAVAEVARAEGRPIVMPTVAPLAALGGAAFPIAFTEAQVGEGLARHAKTNLSAATAAILSDGSQGAAATVQRFKATFESLGGKIVAEETYDLASEDYSAPLAKIDAVAPNVVLLPASTTTTLAIVAQAQKYKRAMTFLGGDTWDTAHFARQAHDGPSFMTHFSEDDPSPATKTFIEAFKKKYSRAPGGLAALSYDAFNVTIEALKRAGQNLKEPLSLELKRTVGFEGATGTFQGYSPQGEALKSGIIKSVKNGALKFSSRVDPPAPPAPLPSGTAKP